VRNVTRSVTPTVLNWFRCPAPHANPVYGTVAGLEDWVQSVEPGLVGRVRRLVRVSSSIWPLERESLPRSPNIRVIAAIAP
jgi:hypothetical protein